MVEITYRGKIFKSWRSYAKALEKEIRCIRRVSNQVICPKCGLNGTKILVKTSCGKPTCSKCKDGPSHGPYFYVVHRVGKKTKKCYIGKTWGPVDNGMPSEADLELVKNSGGVQELRNDHPKNT